MTDSLDFIRSAGFFQTSLNKDKESDLSITQALPISFNRYRIIKKEQLTIKFRRTGRIKIFHPHTEMP